jgi:hypothetical protein
MAGPDPIEPAVNLNDVLTLQSIEVGSDSVTWASGTATSPSKARSRFTIPQVGLLSRVYLDFDGGAAAAFDFTAGGGTGAAPATLAGPFSIVKSVNLMVNGGAGFYSVSGFGTFLLNSAESDTVYPTSTVPGQAFTSPAGLVYAYDPTADSRPRFGLEIPVSIAPGSPLGMILAGNDQTTIEVVIEWDTLDNFSTLAGGASATLALTATVQVEVFDVPNAAQFNRYVRPLLRWAHWCNEERQEIVSTGAGVNNVVLDNHDTYLQIIHALKINGVFSVAALEKALLRLNRAHTRYDEKMPIMLRKQRRSFGKDLPAVVWTFYEREVDNLRDALRADRYTDIRAQLDITSGTTLGSDAHIRTISRRLIDLGAPPAAAV